jgi:hypothetical protein
MSYTSRELLIKSVLTALPTYFLSIFKMHKWGFKKLISTEGTFFGKDKIMKMSPEGGALLG